MNRKTLGFLIILISLVVPVAMAQNVIRCESDYGRRHVCSFDGWGRAALSHQLSRTACVEGETWGREGRNSVWVSNGCRADFIIARGDREDRREERRNELIVCRSNGRFTRCAAGTRFGVQLSRQLSGASCIEGRSWGYDREGVWVDRGCAAEFLVVNEGRGWHRNEGLYRRTVVCESNHDARRFCEADTRFGVDLRRQLSTSDCILNRTWGYNDRGIWVKDGCRAEFTVGR
jgi:Protein of unknown function (DUF3011)